MVELRSETVVVVSGGDPVDPVVLRDVPDGALVVAADSGVDHALALGLRIHLAVGDLDSVTPEGLARAEAAGAVVQRHPVAKDATDLELALDAAVGLGATRVVVLGGHGGRLDHLLANALLLASPRYAGLEVVARMGGARVAVVRGSVVLQGEVGELVTLLPVHGPALGVRTEGLRFPLVDEDLPVGTTRGVSNEHEAPEAVVTVREGTLLAIHAGAPGPQPPRNPT